MKYIPKQVDVTAFAVTSVDSVNVTLDDGSTATLPGSTVVGSYQVIKLDGSVVVLDAATFAQDYMLDPNQ